MVARYVQLAQQVSAGTPLFRLSDFDPLLCPIQIPERDIPKVQIGQQGRAKRPRQDLREIKHIQTNEWLASQCIESLSRTMRNPRRAKKP